MLKYSPEQRQDLLRKIYEGDITPDNLPVDLYHAIADDLKKKMYEGFGSDLDKLDPGSEEYELLSSLRDNVYMFSAAKTFQVVKELEAVANGDLDKTTYEEQSSALFDLYNDVWQETEANTAELQALSAQKWGQIEKDKEALPYLVWNAVGDEHTDEECLKLNGLTLPVDHEFWDTSNPPLHWNCRCVLEQVDVVEEVTTEEDVDKAYDVIGAHTSELFQFNSWKEREIFPPTHPYFDVPKEYKKLAEENFGLLIPKTDKK